MVAPLKWYLQLSRRRAAEGHLSLPVQFAEMTLLYLLRRIGPGYYHSARLWRSELSLAEKLQWVSEKKYRKLINRYNPAEYHKLSQHKLSEKALLSLLGFPAPEFYGLFHQEYGRRADGQPLRSAQDIRSLLEEKKLKKFCVKELEGWGGRGFHAVEICRQQEDIRLRSLNAESTCSIREFLDGIRDLANGVLLESYVEQHSLLSTLNPSSLNTLRVIVFWPFGQKPYVVGAFVRIGRMGSLVDNTSSGGMAAVIDVKTGELGSAHFKPPHPDEFEYHPDHGGQIKGILVPCWEEIKQLVCSAIQVFPHMRFCGFDIGVTENGPVIIELNVEPDKTGLMQIGVPIARLFSNDLDSRMAR